MKIFFFKGVNVTSRFKESDLYPAIVEAGSFFHPSTLELLVVDRMLTLMLTLAVKGLIF